MQAIKVESLKKYSLRCQRVLMEALICFYLKSSCEDMAAILKCIMPPQNIPLFIVLTYFQWGSGLYFFHDCNKEHSPPHTLNFLNLVVYRLTIEIMLKGI